MALISICNIYKTYLESIINLQLKIKACVYKVFLLQPQNLCFKVGVSDGDRTHDHRNHNPALYRLSYAHHYENADLNVFQIKLTMLLFRD